MKFKYCLKCGWISGPYPDDLIFAGPGGQMGCPVCTHYKQNRNIEVWGVVCTIEVAGWEPEIQKLQSLLSFYHEVPTVEDIDAYLKRQDRLKGYAPPEADVVRGRELILSLFERIRGASRGVN